MDGVTPGIGAGTGAGERYDRLAPIYGPMTGWWERPVRDRGIDMLDLAPGEAVLEVGCGPGAALPALAGSVAPAGEVCGVDISWKMCERAIGRVRRHHLQVPVAVVRGDARRLPFAPGRFDAGLMSFTLELFGDSEIPVVLSEVVRVLRPGGRLAVVSLTADGPDTAMRWVYRKAHRRFPDLLDCRPIPVAGTIREAGLRVEVAERASLGGLPVEVVRARAG